MCVCMCERMCVLFLTCDISMLYFLNEKLDSIAEGHRYSSTLGKFLLKLCIFFGKLD